MTEPVIGRSEIQAALREFALLRRRVDQLERRATSHVSLAEISDPDAPTTGSVRLYARDTGGKTELAARFPTGAVQQVAIEP
jgi:hypothetical protein